MASTVLPSGPVLSAADAARLGVGVVGGKGARLGALVDQGFPVPAFFCVSTGVARALLLALEPSLGPVIERIRAIAPDDGPALDAASRDGAAIIGAARLLEADRRAILDAFDERFEADARVSVRSSAPGEDSAEHSFAGQHESFLHVARDEVVRRVLDCIGSGFASRALAYRRRRGIAVDVESLGLAVVVQRMAEARAAGVLFTADPTTGDRGVAVVSAGLGLGEGVVADRVEVDTVWLDRATGAVRERRIPTKTARVAACERSGTRLQSVPPAEGAVAALAPAELAELLAIGERIEARAGGVAQDVEWAFDTAGALWILQARPITTLPDPDAEITIFDNANIVESYPGVSRPLTFSFVRPAYGAVFRECLRLVGVPAAAIDAERELLERLVGLVDGRIYYDILRWYRIYELLGLEAALPAWERAMGLPPRSGSSSPGGGASLGRARLAWSAASVLLTLERRTRAYLRALDEELTALGTRRLGEADPAAILGWVDQAERRLIGPYGVALLNDFVAQQLFDRLGGLIERWGLGERDATRNELLCGESGVESVAPVRSLLALAEEVRRSAGLRAVLEANGDEEAWAAFHRDAELADFARALDRHVELYGDRTLQELKLETPRLDEEPALVIAMLRNYVRGGQSVDAMERRERTIRRGAERQVERRLAGRPFRRAAFHWVLRHARAGVRRRENLRLGRSRAFGIFKRLFTALGGRLVGEGRIDVARDVTWLTVDELRRAALGDPSVDLRELVRTRRREYEELEQRDPPGRVTVSGPIDASRIVTDLSARLERPEPASRSGPASGVLRGIGCSPGRVTGAARVVTRPDLSLRIDGEILVAPMTDPGWVFLMVAAGGLVAERGSPLSHTAIIGRELGIPTVVAVAGATRRIASGDRITIDGAAGTVVVEPGERRDDS